jgi:hypothetical protein
LTAIGEGTTETGSNQGLSKNTVLRADILNADTELIIWNGNGDVTVLEPDGSEALSLNSTTFQPSTEGTYEVRLDSNQFDGTLSAPTQIHDWDLSVIDANEAQIPGRVWSYYWLLTSGTADQAGETNMSWYAVPEGGSVAHSPVVEVRYDGMSGSAYATFGNSQGPRDGLSGPQPWKSVLTEANGSFAILDEYPLYLNPPQKASYSFLEPLAGNLSLNACEVSVDTDVDAVAQVLCDLDSDGIYMGPDDMRVVAPVTPGTNTFAFDGTDISGQRVPGGEYQCRALVMVGLFHHVGIDMETSFEGLRMFHVSSGGARDPLLMYWDDTLVQYDDQGGDRAVSMPACGISPEISPVTGVTSGSYSDPAKPFTESCNDGNARAWGNFSGSGKANSALMDTYTWIASAQTDALLEIDPVCFGVDIFADGFEGNSAEE